ncbi:diphthamide biosynthesis protein [Hanseniaspora valbyensis NRRL Y-1626]|uniref:2-(3-amino-3-carboxypropyl)histidine synthase subunit 2 n=1 Tax=Hanseniaspora valbyensis NRRL Y-1626 TaxID=766949 RepID=A0A1B7TGM7_9ASCO|nr:diphthamide biosynthesis protein [Hanseniaspora valbyensis NRRL Y-1626]
MSESNTIVPPVLSSDQAGDENFNIVKTNIHHKREYLKLELVDCKDPELIYNELSKHYDLEQVLNHLKQTPCKRIALQFPDNLVMDSSYVIKYFQENDTSDEREYFILADTSYSFCCVDEVASEHLKGDLVVHFGESCFTQVNKISVVYSLGNPYLDIENVVEQIIKEFPDSNESIVLMAGSAFNKKLIDVNEILKLKGYNKILISGINYELTESANITIFPENTLKKEYLTDLKIGSNRYIYNINNLKLDMDLIEDYLQNSALLHITEPTIPSLMELSTVFNSIVVYHPIDNSIQKPSASLMKRYKEMHKARSATTFGILVNTLSIKNTKETINKITKLLSTNYKKSHIFIVGKPNVAKLANFENIDVWICVGCPQSGVIIDSFNEFYKPIITPFELTLAMEREVSWTGKWVLDNGKVIDIINEKIDEEELERSQNEDDYDEDEPVFDAVKGVYVSNSKPLRNINRIEVGYENSNESDDSKALVKNMTKNLVLKDTYSTAAESLQKREWKGLGSNFAKGDDDSDDSDFETEGASIRQGISGVARGYRFDRENN